MSKILSPVHRVPMNEDTIAALMDYIDESSAYVPKNPVIALLYKKLRVYNIKIEEGIKKPDYIPSGIKRESNINLNALGASADEILISKATPEQLMDAEFEAATYNADPANVKLPISRFIGKTWQQVTDEVSGKADVSKITDVAFKEPEQDSNKGALDDMFGKL